MLWVETPTNPLLQDRRPRSDRRPGEAQRPAHRRRQHLLQPLSCSGRWNSASTSSSTRRRNISTAIPTWSAAWRWSATTGDLADQLKFLQNAVGAISGPFDSFLALRGIKTLALRMERHSANGLKIAEWLESRNDVRRVIYPGLPSHPQHDDRQAADVGLRRHDLGRARPRPRGDEALPRAHAAVHARRKPRRRRKPDRASGADDARLDPRRAARARSASRIRWSGSRPASRTATT